MSIIILYNISCSIVLDNPIFCLVFQSVRNIFLINLLLLQIKSWDRVRIDNPCLAFCMNSSLVMVPSLSLSTLRFTSITHACCILRSGFMWANSNILETISSISDISIVPPLSESKIEKIQSSFSSVVLSWRTCSACTNYLDKQHSWQITGLHVLQEIQASARVFVKHLEYRLSQQFILQIIRISKSMKPAFCHRDTAKDHDLNQLEHSISLYLDQSKSP